MTRRRSPRRRDVWPRGRRSAAAAAWRRPGTSPAKEVAGAGPIAAPTATPMASIAAASTAVPRRPGQAHGPRRRRRCGVVWGSSSMGNSGSEAVRQGSSLEHNSRVEVVFIDKIGYLDRIYRDYGMFARDRMSTNCQHHGTEYLLNDTHPPSLRRPDGGRCARGRGACGRLGADHDHDQRRHRVLPARLAAGGEVRQTAPAQSQVQDRPGRRPDRHQRRRRRPRDDRRRLA